MGQALTSLSRGIGNGHMEILEKEEGEKVIILLKSRGQKVSTKCFTTFFFIVILNKISLEMRRVAR